MDTMPRMTTDNQSIASPVTREIAARRLIVLNLMGLLDRIQTAAQVVEARYGVDKTRMAKAVRVYLRSEWKRLPSGNFQVVFVSCSTNEQFHTVNPVMECCSCNDCHFRQVVCCHLAAWLIHRELIGKEISVSSKEENHAESYERLYAMA